MTHRISLAAYKNCPCPTTHIITIRVTTFFNVATPPGDKPLAQTGPISSSPGTVIQEL